jgi:apolipoprotein N-acyltransferase
LYSPDGNQSAEKYYKIHLVPFGEYIPFTNIPLIHKLLLKFSPYDFDYTLNPGREHTAFEMKEDEKEYRFSVIICYEDAVPYEVREFVLDRNGRKRIEWLVNISNDGWFVKFEDNRVITSTELAQHTANAAFRAIENRLGVVRSVNTGISCMIDSLGRIRDGYAAGNLPEKAFDRGGVEGWFCDRIAIDSRITFFSRYGQWLDWSCQLCLAAILTAQIAERFIFRKTVKKKELKK